MFQEIKIISDTFNLLKKVISYKSNFFDKKAGISDSLLHFAKSR